MVILGVSDGPSAGAAVAVDDRIVSFASQARLDGAHRARSFPWEAAEVALRSAGLRPEDVTVVGLAGRSHPGGLLRRRPMLRKLISSPFSPLLDAQVFWQAALRQSGFGAFEADVAAEWLEARFRDRGYRPRRSVVVGKHRALAEAAYRLQPHTEALVVTVHPMGDGTALAVHLGRDGQLDRVFEQEGFASLHVHLRRAVAAMGLRPGIDDPTLGDLAAHGTRDATLDRLLGEHLRAEGPRLSRAPYLRSRGRPHGVRARMRGDVDGAAEGVYRRIRELKPADAAASILHNLGGAVREVVRHHVRRHGVSTVALAGAVFEHPRVVAQVAELDGVDHVSVLPEAGEDLLPWGAAVSLGGLSPHRPNLWVGPPVDDEAVAQALTAAGLTSVRRASLAERLSRGEAVLRFRGRAGPGALGLGERCVLVRGDDAYAQATVRSALGLPDEALPLGLVAPSPNESLPEHHARIEGPMGWGSVAPTVPDTFARRFPPLVGPDGRARVCRVTERAHPSLHRVLRALMRSTGCGALAAFPLVEAGGPPIDAPRHAIELWRRAGFGAMQLGSHYIEREDASGGRSR